MSTGGSKHPGLNDDTHNSNTTAKQQQQQQQQQTRRRRDHPSKKKPQSSLRILSHSLSWALRHAAPELHLNMTPDGFVPLDQVLHSSHPKLRGWTEEQIRQVVAENDKQRFSLQQRPAADYRQAAASASASNQQIIDHVDDDNSSNNMIWCIRANQGHSISGIDPHLLLTKLQPDELAGLDCIVHGTNEAAWETILKTGYLSRMKRNHIHFASGLPGQYGVISGIRKSCQIYIYIHAERCARDGIVFFRSDNGVLLTIGVDEEGKLPISYISHVTGASGRILLDQRSLGKNE